MKQIPLTQGKVALVDDEDYERLNQYKWFVNARGYAVRWSEGGRKNRRMIYMHRSIINTPEGMDSDHIDGKHANNQKTNLRVVTHRENCMNRHHPKSSRFPGVTRVYDNKLNPWKAYIKIDEITKYIGNFPTEEEAHEAYSNEVKLLRNIPLQSRSS